MYTRIDIYNFSRKLTVVIIACAHGITDIFDLFVVIFVKATNGMSLLA